MATLPPLASVEDLTAYLGGRAVPSATATLALRIASAAVRRYCGQDLSLVEDDTVTLYGTSEPEIILPQLPAREPTAVLVDGIATADWIFLGDRIYRPFGWLTAFLNLEGSVFPLADFLPKVPVQVTYTHGYTAVPDEVLSAVLGVAARQVMNPMHLRSETIRDYSYTTEAVGRALTPDERDDLQPFRRRGVSSTKVR